MFCPPRRPTARRLTAFATGCALLSALISACSKADDTTAADGGVALIIKTEANPFFVDILRTVQEHAAANGLDLTTVAGTEDGDVGTQVAAIDAAIERGDRAILITPSGAGVDNALKRARDEGIFVVALDPKPTNPSAADITFATDNFEAGRLIGAWAAEKMAGRTAVIALLELFGNQHVESDHDRNQGFLTGMGIPVGDYLRTGDEPPTGVYRGGDYRIACQEVTLGAAEVLRAAGNAAVVVSVDGGCSTGLRMVSQGIIGATAQQYPARMATQAVDAVVAYLEENRTPIPDTGVDMIDTGVALVTDDPQPGVPSITVAEGLQRCWGKAA